MIRELTVRENITFSARMRLPRQGWTDAQIRAHVNAVIEVLGLSECADTLIGDVESRGVSGGQRKRTNIGIELAVAPAAIFLEYVRRRALRGTRCKYHTHDDSRPLRPAANRPPAWTRPRRWRCAPHCAPLPTWA